MKVLWVTNLPPAAHLRASGRKALPLGSWFASLGDLLVSRPDVKLLVAFPEASRLRQGPFTDPTETFYPLPVNRHAKLIDLSAPTRLLQAVRPDVVHLHGTELPHTLPIVQAAKAHGVPTVLGIQGLVSVISHHLGRSRVPSGIRDQTLRSLIRRDSVRGLERLYASRGKDEIAALALVDHVVGRTDWDRACAGLLAPQAQYHTVNETLRPAFYGPPRGRGDYAPHTILLSQGANPIKGIHQSLEAVHYLTDVFPDLELHVTGQQPFESSAARQRLLGTSYGSYVRRLVSDFNLEDHLVMHGYLDENGMRNLMRRTHVYLSASLIENESNSLSEAKMLGVPSVASYVGGVTSRLSHGVSGFHYQHDAPYMLAHYLRCLLQDLDLSDRIGRQAHEEALQTNDRDANLGALLSLYEQVSEGV